MATIRLGLIGGNIAASKSPLLHRIAGEMCGLSVTYELLIPQQRKQSFEATFETCRDGGYRGVNITYPFKEQVIGLVSIEDQDVLAVGACNTVVFQQTPPRGDNTDYSGFMQAFRETFGPASPGRVAMAGTGGVGKASAFALARLGMTRLALYDTDQGKARALATRLTGRFPDLQVVVAETIEDAMEGADGFVNCTPLGMEGHPGTAFPATELRKGVWGFDAVYTPVETSFIQAARAAKLAVMTGYELFLHQGIDAFRIFTGQSVDSTALRRELKARDLQSEATR